MSPAEPANHSAHCNWDINNAKPHTILSLKLRWKSCQPLVSDVVVLYTGSAAQWLGRLPQWDPASSGQLQWPQPRFSEPAGLRSPANHCFNENRWSATWFWSFLSKVFRSRDVLTSGGVSFFLVVPGALVNSQLACLRPVGIFTSSCCCWMFCSVAIVFHWPWKAPIRSG